MLNKDEAVEALDKVTQIVVDVLKEYKGVERDSATLYKIKRDFEKTGKFNRVKILSNSLPYKVRLVSEELLKTKNYVEFTLTDVVEAKKPKTRKPKVTKEGGKQNVSNN